MGELADLQHRFAGFLTGQGDDIRDLVAEQGEVSIETRLGIYRNAYRLRLRETVDTDHEMLGLYLGDALFEQLVDAYIERHPSHFFSLRDFTSHLPLFLREAPPFADHPILAELAAFERLLLDVFDAPDAPRANIAHLRQLSPDRWPELQLRFHPSMQLFRAEWNCVECWQALKAGETPPAASPQPASHWLLWRGRDRLSQFRSLPPPERALILETLAGAPLSALCERLASDLPQAQVGTHLLEVLREWLDQGLILSWADTGQGRHGSPT
jgi:hypothetical protein